MGWRFQRRRRILPGVSLNVGKRSGSLSFGRRGARANVGPRRVGATLTLVGSGLAYVWRRRRKGRQ